MRKVRLKVTRPTPPDDGTRYPKGHVKPDITYVELPIDCDCDEEACCKATEQCECDFEGCCIEVETVETIDRPSAPFNQLSIEDEKKADNSTKTKTTRPVEKTGNKGND